MNEQPRIQLIASEAFLFAPYNPALPSQAKAIGGHWDAANRAWVFPAGRLEEVRALSHNVYGIEIAQPSDRETKRAELTTRLEHLVAESNRIHAEIQLIQEELVLL